jgi:hypothetical protein
MFFRTTGFDWYIRVVATQGLSDKWAMLVDCGFVCKAAGTLDKAKSMQWYIHA